ncbi:hypothetical protein AB0G64_31340 [Streptomyces longwoodensis]|uniref:hypothetical protein n=1 Tax=Streptomyces longwoodensis TaxID=68231 RepID=UPI0033FAC1D7
MADHPRRLRAQFTPAYETAVLAARLDIEERRSFMSGHQHDAAFIERSFRAYAGML